MLKNLGFDEEFAETAAIVVTDLAESARAKQFAIGMIVVGGGVALWNFFFGDDGKAAKQGVILAQPTPTPASHEKLGSK